MSKKAIANSYSRIKARYKRKMSAMQPPTDCCDHCGASMWDMDVGNEPFWRCFVCGARGFWKDGQFVQNNAMLKV